MNRIVAVSWLLSATAALLILFQIKQDVHQLEEQLASTHRQILREQEVLHVLQAEWSYLNRPERIAQLAHQHLGLDALGPKQIVDFAALPRRPAPSGEADEAAPAASLTPLLARGGAGGAQAVPAAGRP